MIDGSNFIRGTDNYRVWLDNIRLKLLKKYGRDGTGLEAALFYQAGWSSELIEYLRGDGEIGRHLRDYVAQIIEDEVNERQGKPRKIKRDRIKAHPVTRFMQEFFAEVILDARTNGTSREGMAELHEFISRETGWTKQHQQKLARDLIKRRREDPKKM